MPKEGQVDEAAIARYREERTALQEKGIRPLLTIHHFSNPMWFERKGAFTKRENLHYYLELVELVIDRFGDLCSDYIKQQLKTIRTNKRGSYQSRLL